MISIWDKPILPTIFPDKTSQIWKISEEYRNAPFLLIKWKFEQESEFLHLAQLRDLLSTFNIKELLLSISYLPYARQDKQVSNTTTFALNTFAKLLNYLKFDKVFIIDPHSKEATKLIKNSIALYPKSSIEETLFKNNIDLIVYPDKGALEKYTKAYDHLNVPFIYGEKVRDQLTGKITHYEVVGDPQDKSILICDDICDGGATFIILTKELLRLGAKKVFLFVSHGLFSNGTQILFENGIQKIITADGEVQ